MRDFLGPCGLVRVRLAVVGWTAALFTTAAPLIAAVSDENTAVASAFSLAAPPDLAEELALVKPLVDRLERWPGCSSLMIPISVPDRTDEGGPARIWVNDVECVGTVIALAMRPSKTPAVGVDSWWAPVRFEVSMTPRIEGVPDEIVRWYMLVPTAAVTADATRLGDSSVRWAGGTTVTLGSLDGELIRDGERLLEETARRLARGVDEPATTAAMLAGLARVPNERWRADVICAALGLPTPPGEVSAPGDMLARQQAARWHAAVGRVWRADERVGERLAFALLSSARIGRVLAPMWRPEDTESAALLNDLLKPSRSRDALTSLAEDFIQTVPRSLACVTDDAPGPWGAPGGARILAANLTDAPSLARAMSREGESQGQVADLAPGASAELVWSLPRDDAEGEHASLAPAGGMTPLRIRVGTSETSVSVVNIGAQARPPGLTIGPMLNDWSRVSLLSGQPKPAGDGDPRTPRFSALGSLFYNESGGPDNAGAWTLYLDLTQADGPLADNDEVTIWLGPTGASRHRLTVKPDGRMRDMARRSPAGSPLDLGMARVVRRDGQEQVVNARGEVVTPARTAAWAVWVPIPATAVEPDGTLRIAVTRSDPRLVRSTWPRPMQVWQIEPGRVGIDTSAWLGLGK